MRYLILIISLTGGFLSFYSFANDVSLPPVTVGTIYHDATLDSNGYFHTTWYGIPYICFDCHFNPDGKTASGTWYINDGSYDVPFPDKKPDIKPDDKPDTKPDDKPDTKPDDKPDVTPPVIDVKPPKPPKPDTGTSGGSSGFSAELSSINSSSADSLYLSYPFDYNFNYTAEQNKQLAQAFLSKLSNVTPPSYYSVDHIYDMMERWQRYYNQLSTPTSSVTYLWGSEKFVGGEHRYLGKIVLPVNSCLMGDGSTGEVTNDCAPIYKPLVINDPLYASRSDYKNGITRCMRNPNDSSCHSSGGDSSGGSGDTSGSHNVDIPSTGGSSPDTGDKPDDTGDKPDNCPSGSHHEPGTMEGSCTTDLIPNPGVGGGSGSGSTDNNDNGDVVAAINAFHADNNKNHKELMDDLNKKPAPPDYTGMEGDFSSMVGGAMSGITDSVKSAWDAGKTAFGEGLSGIDSMLPNIKTSFDLPPGFEAASLGRCIPVVLDFDIKLIGIPDYHFHAVGTQVCLLYDKYIRPVLNFVMVMLSFFVIHRLLIRSAEFLTDGRN
ncbi:hypothetical protein OHU06_005060 [Salmonella enterica]|nr:hypothetical protein [Salmonella enterica]